MALHYSLSIYKDSFKLLKEAVEYVRNMPRDFKPNVGVRVRELCVDLLLLIAKANAARDKAPHIDILLERNEELTILFRLCQELKFISKEQYAKAIGFTTSIGKQANKWKEWSNREASPVI